MIDQDIKKIESSKEYKSWKSKHKNSFLCGCFSILENIENIPEWQVDFYDSKQDIISSFIIKDDQVILSAEDKVFKKPADKVEKLDIKKVKVKLDNALSKVDQIKNENCPQESIAKAIIILQNIKIPIWNISYMTTSMNILNVKINASDNKIIDHDFLSMLKFKAA